ncbi:unnamed protein product [Gulo gulo]|uniref:Uncharacterized protein n=1 Tax=Gulo gulo TaxID=48420 RepID=A0A9X9Q022_GULGU|nr:unnamed protein product [Gulo gulo]
MALCLFIPNKASEHIHRFTNGGKEKKVCPLFMSAELDGKR